MAAPSTRSSTVTGIRNKLKHNRGQEAHPLKARQAFSHQTGFNISGRVLLPTEITVTISYLPEEYLKLAYEQSY